MTKIPPGGSSDLLLHFHSVELYVFLVAVQFTNLMRLYQYKWRRSMRKVFYYKHNGFVPVEDFINKSDEKVKKKFLFCVGYILGEPGVLSEPYVKHISLSSELYEIRFKASGKLIRILFYEEDSNVYLLHAFCVNVKMKMYKNADSKCTILASCF